MHFIDGVEDLDRDHLGIAKDQGRAQVGEGPDEHNDRSGEVAGQKQGQRHCAKDPPAAAAQVMRGFPQRRINVRHGGAHI
jgi:hypothetical protein